MKLIIKVTVQSEEEAQQVADKFMRRVAYEDMTDEEYAYVLGAYGGPEIPMTLDYKDPMDAGIDLLLEE